MKLNISNRMQQAADKAEETQDEIPMGDTATAVAEPETVTPEVVDTLKPATKAPSKKRGRKKKEPETTALSTFVDDGADGFGGEDLETPYLNLVQPGSEMHELVPETLGQWVFDKAYALGESIDCIVVAMRKKFQEVLEDDDDSVPKIFDTKEEAIAQGFDDVRPIAIFDLMIAVAVGSDEAEAATVEVGEHAFILARYYARGRSFGAARSVFTAKKMKKDPHTCCRWYTFTAKVKPARKKNFRVAVVHVGEPTSEEIQQLVLESTGE